MTVAMLQTFDTGRVPRILAGEGRLSDLGALALELGGHGALLVADPGMQATGRVDAARAALAAVLPVEVCITAPGEPKTQDIDRIADVARGMEHPVVVGLGGGSALDIAKQAAVVAAGRESIGHYLLCAHPFTGRLPIIAVPTTSGTGAEVTRTAIVSDADGRKLWTWGDGMLPDVVLLDPTLTTTLPAPVTAATGLDAFVHALEAVTGQRRNGVAAAAALQAIRLTRDALLTAVREPGNTSARLAMQQAALLAGVAIDSCGTGIAHNIGHALGTLYGVPHGVSVALALDAALGWNIAGNEAVFAAPAAAFGTTVEGFAAAYRAFLHEVGFAAAVAPLAGLAGDASALLDTMLAPENAPMLSNNVRVPTEQDRAALAAATVERLAYWLAERKEAVGGSPR